MASGRFPVASTALAAAAELLDQVETGDKWRRRELAIGEVQELAG